jgi:hypothetical protein
MSVNAALDYTDGTAPPSTRSDHQQVEPPARPRSDMEPYLVIVILQPTKKQRDEEGSVRDD